MFGWFKSRRLEDVVEATIKVKVQGIIFHLKKLDPLDYASGAQAMHMQFDTFDGKKAKSKGDVLIENSDRIREHYIDVIMCSVKEPKLSRKDGVEGHIFVEKLFTDWSLVEDLYLKILEVTYGKKKLNRFLLRAKNSSRLTS